MSSPKDFWAPRLAQYSLIQGGHKSGKSRYIFPDWEMSEKLEKMKNCTFIKKKHMCTFTGLQKRPLFALPL